VVFGFFFERECESGRQNPVLKTEGGAAALKLIGLPFNCTYTARRSQGTIAAVLKGDIITRRGSWARRRAASRTHELMHYHELHETTSRRVYSSDSASTNILRSKTRTSLYIQRLHLVKFKRLSPCLFMLLLFQRLYNCTI
jgi:hypothetical protein